VAKKQGGMTVKEHKLSEQHRGHAQHLCDLVAKRKMAQVGRLAKNAKYVCHICGRAAAKASNLCEAVQI
jgi:hypothetical protein